LAESHRYVYSKYIVDRLKAENILHVTENWFAGTALPLPAQFLMNTSHMVKKKALGLDFWSTGGLIVNKKWQIPAK